MVLRDPLRKEHFFDKKIIYSDVIFQLAVTNNSAYFQIFLIFITLLVPNNEANILKYVP